MSRTEFAKLALGMVVGRYMSIGLPRSRPAGLVKSRCDGRRFNGSVNIGAGAAGRSDAALSVLAAAVCWEKLEGTPAANVSMTAAMARSR